MDSLPETAVIAVIGAGTMGAGIAQVAAAAGHPVRLFDAQPVAAEAGIGRIAAGLDKLVTRQRLDQSSRDAMIARLQPVDTLADLAGSALVIEAIVENLEIKQGLFSELETLCGEHCILATNTSSISVTAIAAALQRPHNLVGMHFFNPAPVMKLVEVISGLATDSQVAATVHATATRWGKKAVNARSTPGFIVNRVARPFYAEALRVMNEQGGNAATLDAVMTGAGGFRMGPFAVMDLIGHDVNFAVTQSVFSAYFNDSRFTPSLIQQELVAAGRLGRKTGRGFYDYRDDAGALPDTAAAVAAPTQLTLYGDTVAFEPLVKGWQQAGIAVERCLPTSEALQGCLSVDGVIVALTDGRTATQRAADTGLTNLVLVDLMLDSLHASHIAISAALQARQDSLSIVAGLFQALDKQVVTLPDIPGMLVMRTVAMLVNEAADAVNQGVCTRADVDAAMQSGVNYPAGPLAWADAIGLATVQQVLQNLADFYGEDRYRCSPLLRQLVAAGQSFHSE